MKKSIPFLILLLATPAAIAMTESWRTCFVDDPCMLADYVYNDSYVPYTDQICTINVTYPNGTMAVTDASMDNNSVGWHNYSYTPPVTGFYPVEVYCSNGIDEGRVEKSFIVWGPKTEVGDGMIYQIYMMMVVIGLGLMFIATITPRHKGAIVPTFSGVFLFAAAFYSFSITQNVAGITYEYIYSELAILWGGLGFLMFGMALWKATGDIPVVIER